MGKSKELDGTDGALHGFTVVGGFQDLSSEYRSIRVLRNDIVGLTIFANTGTGNEREAWRTRGRYVVAYESDPGPDLQTEQVILETDDATALWRLWEMINSEVDRIQREIETRLAVHNVSEPRAINSRVALESMDVEAIAGFEDPDVRTRLMETLKLLSRSSADDAYAGFVNAVYSKVDDWLMSLRHGKVNGFSPSRDESS